ncbi:MAG TPA: proton-conducting transporter membrane subunit, partial [Gemmatimonadales bacterium]|nr:proton-conducting transporter membrane subunit [Gemmatimonadales bacterium]
MLSLLGFPGTVGFIGKWYIISAIIAANKPMLAILLVVTSVISAGYYLPVVMSMYMRPARAPMVYYDSRLARTAGVAVTLAVIGILALGVWPVPALDLSDNAAASLPVTSSQSVAGN